MADSFRCRCVVGLRAWAPALIEPLRNDHHRTPQPRKNKHPQRIANRRRLVLLPSHNRSISHPSEFNHGTRKLDTGSSRNSRICESSAKPALSPACKRHRLLLTTALIHILVLRQTKSKKKLGIKTGKPICCCCPDTKKARDECVVFRGEDDPECKKLIELHKICLRDEGFDVK